MLFDPVSPNKAQYLFLLVASLSIIFLLPPSHRHLDARHTAFKLDANVVKHLSLRSAKFQTAVIKNAHEELRFLVVGDWGVTKDAPTFPLFRQIAHQMELYAAQHPIDFIVSTGDNFYPSGIQSEQEERVDFIFKEMFSGRPLQVPWYSVLGNHDCMGNVDAQLAIGRRFPNWQMNKRYYNKLWSVTSKQGASIGSISAKSLVNLVFLDTCSLVCEPIMSMRNDLPPTDDRVRRCQSVAHSLQGQNATDQLNWVSQTLKSGVSIASSQSFSSPSSSSSSSFSSLSSSSGAGDGLKSDNLWNIVVGHWPIYSVSTRHGDTPELKSNLLPVLKQFHVDAYFAGHDHNLQHISVDHHSPLSSPSSSASSPSSPIASGPMASPVSASSLTSPTGRQSPLAPTGLNGGRVQGYRPSAASVVGGGLRPRIPISNSDSSDSRSSPSRDSKLNHFLSGSGGKDTHDIDKSLLSDGNELMYADADSGFMAVTITPWEMRTDIIDINGNVLHSHVTHR